MSRVGLGDEKAMEHAWHMLFTAFIVTASLCKFIVSKYQMTKTKCQSFCDILDELFPILSDGTSF